jgi:hypothetical protein
MRPPVIAAPAAVAGVGRLSTAHLLYAEALRGAIPAALQAAARDPLGASTLIYALLLSDDEAPRRKQLQELAAATSDGVCQETVRILPEVQAVATHAKLPLVNLALPTLRNLSSNQYTQFRAAVRQLIESDGQVVLFEYMLQKLVLRHLDPHFLAPRKTVIQYYALKPLAPDCATLLSALAYLGQEDPGQVETAFLQGAQAFSGPAQEGLRLLPADQCGLDAVDASLDRLSQAVPQIKKTALLACAQTVAADGVIQEAEAELLRAIADTLDCPIPPFIRL